MSVNFDEIMFFFWFMANLQPSQSRIPGAWFIKLTFSFTITFNFTKTENKTKKSLTQLPYCCFEKRYYFCQKRLIFYKKKLISTKLTETNKFRNKYYLLEASSMAICVTLKRNKSTKGQIRKSVPKSCF